MMKKLLILVAVLCFAFGCRQARGPQLVLSAYNYDFGVIDSAVQYAGSVTLSNCGDADLLIETVNTGCACTSVQYPTEAISPGKTGVLRFTYDTKGKTGEQNQFVSIITNTDSLVHLLKLTAFVESPI